MTQLTQNEIVALKACLNYDTREGQLLDNYSNGGTEKFMKVLGWNVRQVAALIGSLEKKGLVFSEVEQPDSYGKVKFNICWLSELGVNTIFDIIEGEKVS